MSFLETQFDPAITNGAVGGPMFKTSVVNVNSGNETRNVEWQYPLHQYNVANGLKTQAQVDLTKALFMNTKGKAYGFRFKDWADYTVSPSSSTLVQIGTSHVYQLVKVYTVGSSSLLRNILKPVSGSLIIYKNSIDVTSNTTIDLTTGLVTWTSSFPTGGDVLTWSGQFDVPVRFDTDVLQQTIDSFNNFSWAQIMMVEIRNPS
jgi:uncharacterized protein (TIGR02217 family)